MPPKIGKKGKGGPQNAPGIKGKATKAVPMDASDSEDDSSDLGSSEEDETPPVAIVKKKPVPAKKPEPSDDDSDDDLEESDEDKAPVNAVKQAKKNVAESDEEDSESEDEEEKPTVGQKRKLPQLTAQPPKKATKGNNKQKPEKDSEDEEDSDEEDSEESEASDDEPAVDLKKQKQFQQTQKNKANVNGKQAQKAAAAEESSEDEEDSDEDSEEEESAEDDVEEEEVEVKTKGKEGKKKNKESVKATNAVPDGDIVTIFCGNLKDDCGPKELKKFFKKNDIEITDARKQVGKRFGYVDLANASDLKAALALDQSSFQDQEIKVEQAKKRPDLTGTPKTPNAAKDRSQKDDKDCTLFVKNLADSVTEKTLREFFSDAVELRMPKSPDGSHKGFAYIEFKDAGVVEKMMNKYQGAELEGQALYLDYVGQKSSFKSPQANKSSGEPGKSKVLFVKNLAYSVTDDKLLDTFEGAVSARIPTFPDTGKPKGFAFIDFESAEAAQEAYDKCQGQDLDGREMKVDFALDKGDRRSSGGNFGGRGGRGGGGGGGRGNFRGGRGGRGGNWDRGGRGGRGGGRGGGDRGFGDKRRSFDNAGSAKNKKVKLDSDSD